MLVAFAVEGGEQQIVVKFQVRTSFGKLPGGESRKSLNHVNSSCYESINQDQLDFAGLIC